MNSNIPDDSSVFDNSEFISINEMIPDPLLDIVAITSDGFSHNVYRCGHTSNCRTWKCSITGWTKLINVIKWKYK